jgi:hypothetical protein
VSDFGRLRSYDRLKLRIEGNDCWGQGVMVGVTRVVLLKGDHGDP